MDIDVVKSLGPVFAAGCAVEQLLKIFDSPINAIVKTPTMKKASQAYISLVIGLLLSGVDRFQVLTTLGASNVNTALDVIVTGVILSAGVLGCFRLLVVLRVTQELHDRIEALST